MACPACHGPLDECARFCPHCGTALGAAPAAPAAAASRRRSRGPFWVFVAAVAVAMLGGGTIVFLVKTGPQDRNFASDPGTAVTQPQPARPPSTRPETVLAAPARDPARAAELFRRAEALRGTQQLDAAIPLYLQALEADPGLAEAEKKLGLCYQQKGDRTSAAERYRRYLATNPPDAERVRAILGTLE